MKRIIALSLTLLMLLAFAVACAKTETPPASSAPPDSPAASSEAPPAASAPAPAQDNSGNITHSGVGFYSDDADWFGRDAYKIAYICYAYTFLNQLLSSAFEEWADRINYSYEVYDSAEDMNNFMSAMETYASMGFDGFLLDPDPTVSVRVKQYAEELDIPFLPVVNPMMDADGNHRIAPGVDLDGYTLGGRQTDWLVENYQSYWGDVDPADIGFIFLYLSANENLILNMEGSRDRFQEIWPDTFSTNFIEGDMLGYAVSAQGGFEYTSTVVTAHPEFKYWFIASCIEDLGQGGARMAEDLGIESNVLICTNGVNWLMQDWENGYDGCWASGIYYAQSIFAEPLVCGLIALIEGRTTMETIWGNYQREGETYSVYSVDTRLVTKDTYKDYLDEIARYLAQ